MMVDVKPVAGALLLAPSVAMLATGMFIAFMLPVLVAVMTLAFARTGKRNRGRTSDQAGSEQGSNSVHCDLLRVDG
jgi:hypothetical protein